MKILNVFFNFQKTNKLQFSLFFIDDLLHILYRFCNIINYFMLDLFIYLLRMIINNLECIDCFY